MHPRANAAIWVHCSNGRLPDAEIHCGRMYKRRQTALLDTPLIANRTLNITALSLNGNNPRERTFL